MGTFGWPVPIDEAFECEWSIDLANGEEGKFLKISFIDYKHNCKSGKRNRLWLKENGYKELFMATYAIYLREEARNWLQEKGYAHLLAMINAAEGNESAQKWLIVHDFEVLYHIALGN